MRRIVSVLFENQYNTIPRIVDVSPRLIILEIAGSAETINGLIDMLKPYGIRDIARTGSVALKREIAEVAS